MRLGVSGFLQCVYAPGIPQKIIEEDEGVKTCSTIQGRKRWAVHELESNGLTRRGPDVRGRVEARFWTWPREKP